MIGIKCPKHVEHIISAINHSVECSWFFFSTLMSVFSKPTFSKEGMLTYEYFSKTLQCKINA